MDLSAQKHVYLLIWPDVDVKTTHFDLGELEKLDLLHCYEGYQNQLSVLLIGDQIMMHALARSSCRFRSTPTRSQFWGDVIVNMFQTCYQRIIGHTFSLDCIFSISLWCCNSGPARVP
uniref:AlNc14C3G373 protein n=1 Tax=Albugo laibachii Nc14 TaxID=890382 RepID=F0VZP4_9STRA|nr:AlNc14C3G373 [Albugo laibachii Nc14]|eukprot:CCA14265.1 AlNc14C3G373 [Albugo laibachii Nc14]